MNLVVGTAGHIDHGKSALVRALTGVQTDRLLEEKRRGITIDLGFAALKLGSRDLAFVDVPGHERFVRNMLAGATGIDAVLFVVAADDSVMPQTREHLEILRFLQVQSGVIAITKSDLVDDSWLDLVEEDVRTLVARTGLQNAKIVRTSVVTGSGLDELRSELASLTTQSRPDSDPGIFRMPIDRAFTLAGHGTVVTGTIVSGQVSVGDALELMPEGRPVRVRALQRHDQSVPVLGRGTRAAINLGGVHHTEVSRGQELTTPGYLQPTQILTVELFAARDAPRPLKHKNRYRLHLGTSEVTASLSLLEGHPPETNTRTYGQLRLARPVVAVFGQPFVLRAESPPTTLAGGRILDPVAVRLRRKQGATLQLIRNLASADPITRVAHALDLGGMHPRTSFDLVRSTGLNEVEIREHVQKLQVSGELIELGVGGHRRMWLPIDVVAGLEARVTRSLGRLHALTPRQSTVPVNHVLDALADVENRPLIHAILDRMAESRKILRERGSISLTGHEPKLSQSEGKLRSEMANAFYQAGLAPPDLAIFQGPGVTRSKQTVLDIATLLCEEQRLVKLDANLYLDRDAENALRIKVVESLKSQESMTMSDLRDLLGTTRKYAVPFGEYLDRIGLTIRDGDQRRFNPSYILAAD